MGKHSGRPFQSELTSYPREIIERDHVKNPHILILIALLASVLVAACSNPYKDAYKSTLERRPAGEASRLLPPTGDVKIVTSTRMRDDAVRMMEEGWLLLGRSKFRDAQIDAAGAIAVAKEVGASVVLVRKEYATTVTGTMESAEWIPPRTIARREQEVVVSGPDSGKVIERDVTTTIDGEYRTTYVPTNTDYYDYAATYWAKSKPPIFGVIVRSLSDSEKVATQSNRGVVVRAVINDSPAFNADILRGDIITSFGGQQISGPDQFFQAVLAGAGKEIVVRILRAGEQKTFTVRLKQE
jgi:hypothetical protein